MTPEAEGLAVRWMPYVRRWAYRSARRLPSLRPHLADLEAEGLLALTRAATDFDRAHGAPFPALLRVRLCGALKSFRLSLRPLGYRRPESSPPSVGPLVADVPDRRQDDPLESLAAAESVGLLVAAERKARSRAARRRRAEVVPDAEFHSWTVLRPAGSNARGKRLWACRCACGTEDVVAGTDLRTGRSRRCRSCQPRGRRRRPA